MSSTSGCSCRVCDGSGWVVRTLPGEAPRYNSGGLSIVLPHVTTWEQCTACLTWLQPSPFTFPITAPPHLPEAPTP